MPRAYRCPMCQGQTVTKNPSGTLYQKCAMCDGAGHIMSPVGRRPAWYALQLVIGANATLTGSIQILATEDFEWQFVMATYTSASLLIMVQDNSSGKPLVIAPNQNSNQGIVPIALFAGTAQLPFPLRPSYRIPRNNTLTVIGTDTSGAQNTLYFAAYGNSLTDQGNPQIQSTTAA